MIAAAASALESIFACPCVLGIVPNTLFFLFMGVLAGLALGAIPGLGGVVGMAMLLPFTFDMQPHAALAMLVGLTAVTTTSDTIPSVLFSVPGTTGSQATILDGHPMARNGEAGRAFGAAYMASLLGGVFGAIILALSIPILRPLVLLLGSPEFFMLGMLGLAMVSVLSGGAPLKGIVAAALGLGVGMIGADPQIGYMRWAGSQLYLWNGLPLVAITLGLFAIPEIIDLSIRGTRISDVAINATRGVMVGIRDALRHWSLVLRCGTLGVWVGFIPGIGASVVDWFAYGYALQTQKGARETFGKGDVRGVIAPESANNAKEGGSMIPTIAFGVPGSAPMALLLAAFMIHGMRPGPDMLTKNLDITYTMIWSLALANVLGTAICLAFTAQLAKVAMIRIHLLAPLVISFVFLAAFQATSNVGDLITLVAFGVLGWFMKRFGWPRPPLILGVVLSGVIETYLFISLRRYGFEWMTRPFVLGIAGLIVFSVYFGIRRSRVAMAR
jgi:TctA family transporter